MPACMCDDMCVELCEDMRVGMYMCGLVSVRMPSWVCVLFADVNSRD